MRRLIAALITPLAGTASAGDFLFPVDCTLGETCFIQQYVDRDPGPDVRDFGCGQLSYDGHTGTDFALLTDRQMQEGVAVLSVAAGKVVAIRDGMQDLGAEGIEAARQAGTECGNGVLLRHSDGLESQYCHLRNGSVGVQPGETVAAGQVLGLIGQSGLTEFPHLHLSIRRNGAMLDPFQPDGAACDTGADQLWADPMSYTPSDLVMMGWSTAIPDYDGLLAGDLPDAPDANAPAMVIWTIGFGSRPGDQLHLEIQGPNGPVFDHTDTLDRAQARFMRAGGLRLRADRWAPGDYTATATLIRNDQPIARTRSDLTIAP